MTDQSDWLKDLTKEIGERLKEIREAKGDSLQAVVDRMGTGTRGYLSRIERGEDIPAIEFLLKLIVIGLETSFSDFCRYWAADDKRKEVEERTARRLLEKALDRGREARLRTIDALKIAAGETAPTPTGRPEKR